MSSDTKRALAVAACVALTGIIAGCTMDVTPPGEDDANRALRSAFATRNDEVNVPHDDGAEKARRDAKMAATARSTTAALMAQWKVENPTLASNWIEVEKASHKIKPSADNSYLLKGGQGKGHAYGNYTERNLFVWAREAEKMVVEGSRIFHNAKLLGGTIGVSCDMCHPDGANTHPETYPKFQAQLGRVVLLRDMINWCIENPVRGKPFAADSPQMRALEAYIMAQRKGVKMEYGKH